MVKIADWLQLNKLFLDLNKTHFSLFRRKFQFISSKTSLSEYLIDYS